MGFKFTLLIYSIAKLSSVQFITAQKMQTYDFDFYCHFNPLQKLFSFFSYLVICQVGRTLLYIIWSSQFAVRKISFEKTIFLVGGVF